jgi:hypothetical protein
MGRSWAGTVEMTVGTTVGMTVGTTGATGVENNNFDFYLKTLNKVILQTVSKL